MNIKITAQRAAAMEMNGRGKFEIRGRSILFTSNDGRTALWGCSSVQMAEVQLRSWRRVFTTDDPRLA